MIKALVVDDEKRVRKGFISLADWSAYGMQIVGEAKDGPSALDLLGREEVHLMFVDISMPGMSGFELIEQARSRYPWTKSVILTCHHEFDYVQEALRIGAIDYIVKTLLNKSNVDETMQRIAKRYAWETRDAAARQGAEREFRSAVVFCPAHPRVSADAPPLGAIGGRKLKRLGERLWMAPLAETDAAEWVRELPPKIYGDWRVFQANADGGMPQAEAERLLRDHLATYLFYKSEPAGPIEIESLKAAEPPEERELAEAFEEWKQLKWLVFGRDWKRFVERIERWRIPPVRLRVFLTETVSAWSGYFDWGRDTGGAAALEEELAGLDRWKAWMGWLSAAALQVQQRMTEGSFSREVYASLIRAVLYMREHAGSELTQDEVAREAGMSRSYFSQCFKRFAGGEAFGDALRRMRIEAAQSLLLQTALPVRDIANRVGFEDEKHFSRVFRDKTGRLPTEFRQAAGGGG
ncbi:response regulator [Cohnella sp. REN36]|uniref:response regulator n=1 Tax=Cohnella sp. REN36 TaxID=2887347 RepID=UPI001D1536CE|nr:response regulator [Cohnella sp. REN36]MCC3374806.1 response regulator [Cohnella sp. REN36]